jgi:CheY-like chemotaxis protein
VADLLSAVATLAWPVLAAAVFVLLYPTMKGVIKSRGFTVKVGAMEVTVQQVSDQLRSQVDDLQKTVLEIQNRLHQPAAPPATTAVSSPKRILWVDDKPQNNAIEIASLRESGFDIVAATSTDQALEFVSRTTVPYGVIISDMGRKERGLFQPEAGLHLLRQLRDIGDGTPFIFYTAHKHVRAYAQQVRALGAVGITASSSELKQLLQSVGGTLTVALP